MTPRLPMKPLHILRLKCVVNFPRSVYAKALQQRRLFASHPPLRMRRSGSVRGFPVERYADLKAKPYVSWRRVTFGRARPVGDSVSGRLLLVLTLLLCVALPAVAQAQVRRSPMRG